MSTNALSQAVAAPRVITAMDLAALVGRPQARVTNFAVVFFITGVVQGFRSGWENGALPLMAGSVASIFGIVAYGRLLMLGEERSFANMFSALSGLLPYLFGCYLVFYRGFWSCRVLFQDFSLYRLLASLAFIYFGYRVVFWCHQLSALGDALRSGNVVVRG